MHFQPDHEPADPGLVIPELPAPLPPLSPEGEAASAGWSLSRIVSPGTLLGLASLVFVAMLALDTPLLARVLPQIPPRDTYVHGAQIRELHDRVRGVTTVVLDPLPLSRHLRVEGAYAFHGDSAALGMTLSSVYFGVASDSTDWRDAWPPRGRLYVLLLLDGERRLSYPATQEPGYQPVAFQIPYQDMLLIAAAERVTVRLDRTEVALGDTDVAAIRDFASRLSPPTGWYRRWVRWFVMRLST
jgi:hypothetical protein